MAPWDAQIAQCHHTSWLVMTKPLRFARMLKAGRIFSLVESIKIFKGPTNNRHSLLALLYHMLYVGIFCLIFLLYSLFPNLHESFLLSSCLRLTVVEGGEDGDANVTG